MFSLKGTVNCPTAYLIVQHTEVMLKLNIASKLYIASRIR